MKILITALIMIASTGCTIKGSVSDEDKNKIMNCVDSRDNSTFSFNTNDITEVRAGFSSVSEVTLTTLDGVTMRILKSDEAFIKCEEIDKAREK